MLDSSDAQQTKSHLLSSNRIFLEIAEESTPRKVTYVDTSAAPSSLKILFEARILTVVTNCTVPSFLILN